ncbi:hypothetical protein SDC9_167278 [bioreactor metagenome]|uniref:Uncharacterized protein n=1 Tax=bioreactor metagenome TaxID=1076179 RepID=A0A645G7J3_9ZZZZ
MKIRFMIFFMKRQNLVHQYFMLKNMGYSYINVLVKVILIVGILFLYWKDI